MAAKLARFSWLPGGLAATLVIAIAHLVSPTPFARLEFAIHDRIQQTANHPPASEIALVTIDRESLAKLGEWPWPRDVHATLIDRLHADGARVIAFATPFGLSRSSADREHIRAALQLLESSHLGTSEQGLQLRRLLGESSTTRDPDARLARAVAAHGNVVLPVEVRVGLSDTPPELVAQLPAGAKLPAPSAVLRHAEPATMLRLPPLLDTAAAFGHLHIPMDIDHVARRDLAGVRVDEGTLMPSLAVAIARRAAGMTATEPAFESPGALRLGGHQVPLDRGLSVRPRHVAPAARDAFAQAPAQTRFPYWQVFSGDTPAGALRDKIVIVGFMDSERASAEAVATPVAPLAPPLLLTADAVASLLEADVIAHPTAARLAEWAIAGGVVLFAACALPAAGLTLGALATALIVAILAVAEIGLLGANGVWVHLMLPCVAAVIGFAAYAMAELIRRANSGPQTREPGVNLRSLGLTFQRQGQLDLAFETFRRCPLDPSTMELLYGLGLDYERRRQSQKAASVYDYIATRDPQYRDLPTRRARVRDDPITRDLMPTRNPPAAGVTRAETPTNLTTRTLGRYEIEREIGKGAMGVVYLGRDPKINRVVAIKAIPLAEEFDDEDLEEVKARFFREAEMAGRLNHPSIVTVYDAGEDQGLAYIAMEYLKGRHLSEYTDPTRLLPPRRVVLLVAKVADALHYAHRQNVVHRDIKPANIMFDPDTEELKITDFGIARLTDTSRTKTGIVLGTPSFMSPEQLEGRTLDGRSDQFALGVSLYQLLCGQLPFQAESMPRLMQKIATEAHAPITALKPDLPESLERIVDRALAKDPDDRFADCAALAAALRECARRETFGRAA